MTQNQQEVSAEWSLQYMTSQGGYKQEIERVLTIKYMAFGKPQAKKVRAYDVARQLYRFGLCADFQQQGPNHCLHRPTPHSEGYWVTPEEIWAGASDDIKERISKSFAL